MVSKYQQLKLEQRNQILRSLNEELSIRALARQIGKSPSTVSCVIRPGFGWVSETYDAVQGVE